jgi:hypothetical protein
MTDLTTIALDLDDGYAELQAKRAELAAAKKQASADYPVQPDPSVAAKEFLTSGADLREAAEREVKGRRVLAEILDHEQVLITRAEGLLLAEITAWLDSHQEQLCEGLQEARVDVQSRAVQLLRTGNPHPDQVRALATEWSELRSEHVNLIGVKLLEASLVWRGLDWVADYATAWPQFFLWTQLDTQIEGAHRRLYGPAERPFDPEVHSASDVPVGDRLTPLEQLRQVADVKVWTPTRQQYDTRTAMLDDLSHRRRYEFVRDAKAAHEAGKQGSITAAPEFITTTKPAWMA